MDEAAQARLGTAEAGEVLGGDVRRCPLAGKERLADGEDGGCGGTRGQGCGGSGLEGRRGGEPAASGRGEAAVGDEEAVGLERRRHGCCRRGGSPAVAGVRGFWGWLSSGKGKVRIWEDWGGRRHVDWRHVELKMLGRRRIIPLVFGSNLLGLRVFF